MKPHLLMYICCIALLFAACTDDVVYDTPSLNNTTETKPHKLTLEQAVKRAEFFINSHPSNSTRGNDRRIQSVDYLTSSERTRSQETDTLLYLVNFADNNGFMLMPADERLIPAYAYSDSGSLNLSDTLDNKVLGNYMNGVRNDVINSTYNVEPFPGTLPFPDARMQLDKRIAPMICEYQSKLHQTDPYNHYCPIINGQHAPVGCGALALEILLSYFKHPRVLYGVNYPWDAMNVGAANMKIAQLFSVLTNPDHLNSRFTENATFNFPSFVAPTLKKIGFTNASLVSFSEKRAEEALSEHPLYVTIFENGGKGHAFIIDGLDKYIDAFHNYSLPRPIMTWRYFHFVWGNAGKSNGYYYVTNSVVQSDIPRYLWSFDASPSDSIVTHDISQMIINIQPNTHLL